MTACPTHPEAEAVGTCARCGRFYCAAERFDLELQTYCGECAARPDVDWLGKHYRALEGKRSGLAWVMLAIGVASFAGATTVGWNAATAKPVSLAIALVVYAIPCVGFFAGWRPARTALLIAPVLAALILGAITGWVLGVGLGVAMLGMALAAHRDLRSRLFFRIEVPRGQLGAHFEREGSNPLAVIASRLALLSLFVPGLGLITLGMGIVALARVDKKATPPIGNVSAALGAVVFSLFTTLIHAAGFLAR